MKHLVIIATALVLLPDWERVVTAVRADLGESASADAWREGAKLDLTQAVQLALRTCRAGS